MRTAGVDLAAESTRTALAIVEWTPERAHVEQLNLNVTDSEITDAATDVTKLGVDCAFGWPDEFVAFITDHANLARPPAADGGMEWRRMLAFRETDRNVHENTGRWPLSVSTDRLGLTAMRCAGLLGRLAASGRVVDRSGREGVVVEVYPGATLRLWGWDTRGYRTDPDVRRSLVERMERDAPWLEIGAHVGLMVDSSDAFDAVIAALTARAAALGQYGHPTSEQQARAEREGWIALPSGSLGDLLSPPPTAAGGGKLHVALGADHQFRATEGGFQLFIGPANTLTSAVGPDLDQTIGMGWVYAIHARSALARGKLWQAVIMLDELRNQFTALVCARHGPNPWHGREVGRLPPPNWPHSPLLEPQR